VNTIRHLERMQHVVTNQPDRHAVSTNAPHHNSISSDYSAEARTRLLALPSKKTLGGIMSMTVPVWVAAIGACAICLSNGPTAAQQPRTTAPTTLIPVTNRNPALVTDRHLAAQAAGYRALHTCTGSPSTGQAAHWMTCSADPLADRSVSIGCSG
jgi:hypothetical protein